MATGRRKSQWEHTAWLLWQMQAVWGGEKVPNDFYPFADEIPEADQEPDELEILTHRERFKMLTGKDPPPKKVRATDSP